jgi:hypothetical protein
MSKFSQTNDYNKFNNSSSNFNLFPYSVTSSISPIWTTLNLSEQEYNNLQQQNLNSNNYLSPLLVEDISSNIIYVEELIQTDFDNNINPVDDLVLENLLLNEDNITITYLENTSDTINNVHVSEIINQIESKINSNAI